MNSKMKNLKPESSVSADISESEIPKIPYQSLLCIISLKNLKLTIVEKLAEAGPKKLGLNWKIDRFWIGMKISDVTDRYYPPNLS